MFAVRRYYLSRNDGGFVAETKLSRREFIGRADGKTIGNIVDIYGKNTVVYRNALDLFIVFARFFARILYLVNARFGHFKIKIAVDFLVTANNFSVLFNGNEAFFPAACQNVCDNTRIGNVYFCVQPDGFGQIGGIYKFFGDFRLFYNFGFIPCVGGTPVFRIFVV